MKKKLLSLVLAGAMVASTSVSAFADTTISSYEDGSNKANVTINGSVDDDAGKQPSGTISVTVPTALKFQVDNKGNFTGSKITITNKGLDKVDIYAHEFKDDTPTSGIVVKTQSDLQSAITADTAKRSDVALWIQGTNGDRAYFKSEAASENKNGIYDANGTNADQGIKVASIAGGSDDVLRLEGSAGQKELGHDVAAINENFTLKLKVVKSTSN